MIRKKIDITGPDGNAFVLLGLAQKYAKQLGLNGDEIVAEMRLGDYENLLNVFDKHFGEYVILETDVQTYLGFENNDIDIDFSGYVTEYNDSLLKN